MLKLLLLTAVILTGQIFSPSIFAKDTPNSPLQDALKKRVSEHTITYQDAKTGETLGLYFGRFGNFDSYIPCEFDDGRWWVTKSGELCIEYRESKTPGFCLTPSIKENTLALMDEKGTVRIKGKYEPGNRLPLG